MGHQSDAWYNEECLCTPLFEVQYVSRHSTIHVLKVYPSTTKNFFKAHYTPIGSTTILQSLPQYGTRRNGFWNLFLKEECKKCHDLLLLLYVCMLSGPTIGPLFLCSVANIVVLQSLDNRKFSNNIFHQRQKNWQKIRTNKYSCGRSQFYSFPNTKMDLKDRR